MSANVNAQGELRQLDGKASPEEQFTEADAADASKVSRVVMRALREVNALKRRFAPNRIDFEGVALDNTGAKVFRFEHRFGAPVRWWVVDWSDAKSSVSSTVSSTGIVAPNYGPQLVRHAESTNDVLMLVSYVSGTATIRVEEAG